MVSRQLVIRDIVEPEDVVVKARVWAIQQKRS